jgi:hypothetical protein
MQCCELHSRQLHTPVVLKGLKGDSQLQSLQAKQGYAAARVANEYICSNLCVMFLLAACTATAVMYCLDIYKEF